MAALTQYEMALRNRPQAARPDPLPVAVLGVLFVNKGVEGKRQSSSAHNKTQ